MSHWNHRVVKHVHSGNPTDPSDYPYFTVHEVYYNDAEEVYLWNPNPASPRGQTATEFEEDAARIGRAFTKPPVVEVDDASFHTDRDSIAPAYKTWKFIAS